MTPPTRTRTSRVYPRECGEAPGHGQVDDEQASSAAIDALVQFSELGTGRVSPDPDCLAPHQAMVHGADQVAADAKQIQDAVRRGITAELVRDQTARGAALALQQRPEESCGSVPMGSGRPGSLLTLAPHRSGRAGSAASGSSTDSFATRRRVPAGPGSQAMATAIPTACLASSAIRCRDVETGPNRGVLAVFPSTGATCRCPLPSTGSRGLNAPASAVL